MTNLEIIKYLATNNPTRLAELLDDIYCCAWNAGAYAANTDGARFSSNEIDDFGGWINQEANANFFFDHELEEWSKKHCKWFFTKHRQNKLRAKIVRRYTAPVFWMIEDMIEDILPQTTNEFFGQIIDVKEVQKND